MVCNIACVFCPPCGGGAARPEAAARRLRRSSLVVPGAPAPRADSSDHGTRSAQLRTRGAREHSTPAPVPGAEGPAEGAAKGPAACIEDIVVLPEMEAHLQLTSEFARMMRSFDQWKSYQRNCRDVTRVLARTIRTSRRGGAASIGVASDIVYAIQ
ncbi:unnamed protein product [Prorocentrum cordatum]|uniref:Uncharacterized protein n=1 Tax=Prorocentrum cordatum TaxID=2364126 RepID=A0ABN9QFF8_9DINO|nr:unnamed protein product [Polarella glacialis]